MSDNTVVKEYYYAYCATCERVGIYLPSRVSIAFDYKEESSHYERVDQHSFGLPNLPEGLIYVLRRVSGGFIYAYCDGWKSAAFNDRVLRAFSVSESGHLTVIDKDLLAVNSIPKEYSCFVNGVSSKGMETNEAFYLDLYPEKSESTKFYVAYSRHQWSNEVCNAIEEDEEIRNKFMHEMDVDDPTIYQMDSKYSNAIIENSNPEKYELIKKMIPWESELIQDMKRFKFNPVPRFANEGEESAPLFRPHLMKDGKIVKDDRGNPISDITKKGVPYNSDSSRILMLNDIVGIIDDILNIIKYLAEKVRTTEEERLYNSAMNVIRMKASVKAKIHGEKFYKLREKYVVSKGYSNMGVGLTNDEKNIDLPINKMSSHEAQEEFMNKMERLHDNAQKQMAIARESFFDFEENDIIKMTKEIESQFNNEWNGKQLIFFDSMADKIKESEMNNWLIQHAKKNENYINNTLQPIVKFYIDCLKSDVLLEYMEKGFDQVSIFSAVNFLKITSKIIGNADTMELCSLYFAELLNEPNYKNRKNYLLRAFNFDSKDVENLASKVNSTFSNTQITTLSAARSQFFDERTISNLENYDTKISAIIEDFNQRINLLSEQIGGTAARVFQGRINKYTNGAKTPAMKSFEIFTGKVLVLKEYSGKLNKVVQEIMRDSKIDFDHLESRLDKKKAVKAFKINVEKVLLESFNSDIELNKLGNTRTKINVIVFLDPSQVGRNSTGLGGVNSGQQVLNDAKEKLENDKSNRINKFDPEKQGNSARAKAGFGLGVFAFTLQSVALINATRSVQSNASSESILNFTGVLATTFGSLADILDRQIQIKISEFGASKSLNTAKNIANFTARVGLFGGAIILASIEARKGVDAYKKDQYFISGAYFVNGAFMVLSTAAFMKSSSTIIGLRLGYWGLIMIAGMVIISYGMDKLDKAEKKKFLSHSAWGVESLGWSLDVEKTHFENNLG